MNKSNGNIQVRNNVMFYNETNVGTILPAFSNKHVIQANDNYYKLNSSDQGVVDDFVYDLTN